MAEDEMKRCIISGNSTFVKSTKLEFTEIIIIIIIIKVISIELYQN